MSSYLFILVMEVLTLMSHRRVRESDSFIYRCCSNLNIINLCFANDLFLSAHGDAISAQVILDSLEAFKNVSGLTPSLPKSAVYFCNVLNYINLDILSIHPFEEGKLHVKYLGVPLVSSCLIFRDCTELVEKVRERIRDWKNKFLSFVGRVQLIRSVLASMHVYWALVFILSSRIMMDLGQLMRGFIWCQGEMRKGKAKVSWEVVCLPKIEGGLGIRRLEAFNKALITSHICSILSLKKSLWVKWIHMYKLRGRTLWEIPLRDNMSWGWRKILQVRPIVRQFIWYRLGDGSRTSAWFDKWCSLSPLTQIISNRNIYGAGLQLSSKVNEIIDHGNWVWLEHWYSKFPDLSTLNVLILDPNSMDGLIWKDHNDITLGFSMATVWDCIRPRGLVVDWYHLVWFTHQIPRHVIHIWLVIKQKLKTHDTLRQWDVKTLIGIPNMPPTLDLIVEFLIPLAKKRSARLFVKQKRSYDQIIEVIQSNVRLKLLSCKFEKTKTIWQQEKVLDVSWKLYVHSWSEERQLKVVLLFSSPRDSCSLKWFLPIGFLVSVSC
uniref:Reverse transcriptase zinc-binding domain-containing protein n=1 Tax=Tanacetum cinerariifolium TaxID=118510 RepID=A0A6L2J2K6_TANCI|nr:hypothetical protein [Tanacetum cinerariifolium]